MEGREGRWGKGATSAAPTVYHGEWQVPTGSIMGRKASVGLHPLSHGDVRMMCCKCRALLQHICEKLILLNLPKKEKNAKFEEEKITLK